jgi:hypothetical protein
MKEKRAGWFLALLLWLSVAMVACQCSAPAPPPPTEPPEEPTEALEAVEEGPTETVEEEPTETVEEEATEEPTAEPTAEPTEEPTDEPTEAPTEEPTEAPTEEPSPSDADVLADLAEEVRTGSHIPFMMGCRFAPTELPAVQVRLSSGGCHVLCVWGFPFDEPVHVELYDPAGQFVAAHDETLEQGEPDQSLKVVPIWLGGRSAGDWAVVVNSGGVIATRPFHLPEPDDPTMSIALQGTGPFATEKAACATNTFARSDRISIFGAGFPAVRTLPLGIYEFRESRVTQWVYGLVHGQTVQTDDRGRFRVDQPLQALVPEGDGSYLATVVLDPAAPDQGPEARFQVDAGISVVEREVTLELGVCGGGLDDERVQRAVVMAVNRSKLSDTFGGASIDFRFSACGTATDISGEPWDPALARRLLTEAGYPDGIQAEFLYPEGDKELAAVAEDMTEDLAPVGISVERVAVPPTDVDTRAAVLSAAGRSVLWVRRR